MWNLNLNNRTKSPSAAAAVATAAVDIFVQLGHKKSRIICVCCWMSNPIIFFLSFCSCTISFHYIFWEEMLTKEEGNEFQRKIIQSSSSYFSYSCCIFFSHTDPKGKKHLNDWHSTTISDIEQEKKKFAFRLLLLLLVLYFMWFLCCLFIWSFISSSSFFSCFWLQGVTRSFASFFWL